MPTYSYKCDDCGHEFDLMKKVADRNLPTLEPCPACSKKTVKAFIGNTMPGLLDPVRMGRKKPPAGFNEVLRNIQKISPNNTIKVRD